MKASEKEILVKGSEYKIYSDFIKRATFAIAPDGTEKMIYGGGYISNPTTVRKAVKAAFNL
jgi:hypothetical protein